MKRSFLIGFFFLLLSTCPSVCATTIILPMSISDEDVEVVPIREQEETLPGGIPRSPSISPIHCVLLGNCLTFSFDDSSMMGTIYIVKNDSSINYNVSFNAMNGNITVILDGYSGRYQIFITTVTGSFFTGFFDI